MLKVKLKNFFRSKFVLNKAIDRSDDKSSIKAFSLIEGMIATLIIGISFAGVYTLSAVSIKNINNSADKQKLQIIANQIFEVIAANKDNIDNYNMDFTSCNAPTSEETEQYHQHRYKWCRMINNSIGVAGTGEVRSISIDTVAEGRAVNIILQNRDNKIEVDIKRIFNI
jgi:Tfp pilus assembly protein PilV